MLGTEWIEHFAEVLGIAPPTEAETETLLALAGVAAHASERTAAPVACWLAARARVEPRAALDLARTIES